MTKISPYAQSRIIGFDNRAQIIYRQFQNTEDGFRFHPKSFMPNYIEQAMKRMQAISLPTGIIPATFSGIAYVGGSPGEYVIKKYNEGIVFTDSLRIGRYIWRVHFSHCDPENYIPGDPFAHLRVSITPRKIRLTEAELETREVREHPLYVKLPRKEVGTVRFFPSEATQRKVAEVIAQIPFSRHGVAEGELTLSGWLFIGSTKEEMAIEREQAIERIALALARKEEITASCRAVMIKKEDGMLDIIEPRFKRKKKAK